MSKDHRRSKARRRILEMLGGKAPAWVKKPLRPKRPAKKARAKSKRRIPA